MNKLHNIKSQSYKRQLQHALASNLKELSKVNSVKSISAVAFDWSVIAMSIAASVWIGHPLVYILSVVIIAARQHALLIIMHDASHYRLIANRGLNDLLSNCLLAYPMLIRTESYRDNHLEHHKHTNTDDDPDWVRKEGDSNWVFPKTRSQLFSMLIRDLLGGGFLLTLKAIYSLGAKETATDKKKEKTLKTSGLLIFWVVAATTFTLTGVWSYVLAYWFLPAWTVLPVLLRLRSIAEHFGLANTHELNASRNYHCNWIETAILAPHNVGYHLDHHLFPTIPFYNLPELHRHLMGQALYAEMSHQSDGYFGLKRSSIERDIAPLEIKKHVHYKKRPPQKIS